MRQTHNLVPLLTRKSIIQLTFLLAVLICLIPEGHAEQFQLTIIHTNDLHGRVDVKGAFGGIPSVAEFIQRERDKGGHFLYLDSGDVVQGSPLSTFTKGVGLFKLMNMMGCDAMTLGNHEFEYGWEHIQDYRDAAQFPILCANARDPKGRLLADEPSLIIERGGLKIGIIGFLMKDAQRTIEAGKVEGVTFEDPLSIVNKLTEDLRTRGAKMLIALTHEDTEADYDLARRAPQLDLILAGHVHSALQHEIKLGKIYITRNWAHGRTVSRIDLTFDDVADKITQLDRKLEEMTIAEHPPNRKVQAAVTEMEAPYKEKLDTVIGEAPRQMTREQLEQYLGNIFREIARSQLKLSEVDFGFQNSGGIRSELQAGRVTVREMMEVIPFENTLMALKLPAAAVALHTKRKLDASKAYWVVTNSYVASHPEIFLGEPLEKVALNEDIKDLVVEYIRAHPEVVLPKKVEETILNFNVNKKESKGADEGRK